MGTPAKSKEKRPDFPIYEMEERGKLILSPLIIAQITYLHSHCGKDEWSGLLLYDVKKGNPSKPETFELEVKHIFLMDIGSAGATDYETDGDIVDIYDQIPGAMEMKLGHIHTHHNGSSYFSNIDMGELQDNVDKHNYYLSLVVSFDGNYAAKIAFLSDMHTTSKMNFKDDSGTIKYFKQAKAEKHMVIINMGIYYGEVGGFFSDRLKTVVKKIDAREKAEQKAREKKYSMKEDFGGRNPYFKGNNLPAHNQHFINNKIIPDKMTSWEIEKLTKNILMFDTDLKTEDNVYSILHQIVKQEEDESQMGLYFDYMITHTERVMDAFFDTPLDNDEATLVIQEIIMCIKKFEGIDALETLVGNIEEVLDQLVLGYTDVDDIEGIEDDKTIADQLDEMEKEMKL